MGSQKSGAQHSVDETVAAVDTTVLQVFFLFKKIFVLHWSMAQWLKNLPAMQETQEMWVQSLGGEDPLVKEMATHSSILAWKIPWTEEPGGLQSMGSQRVGYDWVTKHNTFSAFTIFKIVNIKKHCKLIYNIVLISGVQQSSSISHTHISILFQTIFSHRALQNVE